MTNVDRLVNRELSRFVRHMMRARMFAAPIVMTVGVMFIVHDQTWRGALCLGLALPVFLVAVWEQHTMGTEPISSTRMFWIISAVLTVQLGLAVATGGITSPVLILFPAACAFLAIVTGRPRLVVAWVAVTVTLCWIFAWLAYAGTGLEPAIFARSAASPALLAFLVFLLTVAPIVCAILGMMIRRALEGAVRSAAESRGEVLRSMRERNDELLALSGALAHELKNPLAAIRGLASLQAKRMEQGTKQAEQMGVLVDEVARMGSILDEFLNFSRPAMGLTIEEVEPASILRDVVQVHEPLAAERSVSISMTAADETPIACDPRKLKQILVNLVQNAIDASPEGQEVVARLDREDGAHVFRITDRGGGLADAVRGRLFTAGVTTKVAGSGLGLTIARAIAEQHGGTLDLRENAGGGCVAEVRLPTAAPMAEDGA
jgi:two-component system, NtrC family, sensor histidine kinase HydH